MIEYLLNIIIALDQTINAVVRGSPDETLSARAYRNKDMYGYPYVVINYIFFWQEDHCRQAYWSEVIRAHLPKDYYNA